MDSRTRIRRTIGRKSLDRLPLDFWAADDMVKRLCTSFGISREFLWQKAHADLRYIPGADYIGPPLETFSDGSRRDIWGVRRKTYTTASGVSYTNVVEHPLQDANSIAEVEDYGHWPDPDWFDYSSIAGHCREHAGYAVAFSGGRLNRTSQLKAGMYLRGVQTVLEDTICEPKLLEAILERVSAFYLEYNRRVFEAAAGNLDIFMMGDDFGMQQGLIVNKPAWQRFFQPNLQRFIDLAKRYDLTVMHHSCGAIRPLIPDFIDMGLDILNPIQPEAQGMDPASLQKEFGRDIVFHGTISIQQTLAFGSPQDVKDEVRQRIGTFEPAGGCILCTAHNIQADVPLENAEALLEAYESYAGSG